jgi:hypothetical protein
VSLAHEKNTIKWAATFAAPILAWTAILNVTRACETAIDLANHIIKKEKLGIPASSAESFSLLARNALFALI